MTDNKTPQPDYEALAKQAYDWLKKRRSKGEISTLEVLMRIKRYKWGSKELQEFENLDLFLLHDKLLQIIKKDKQYMADFSAYKDMCVGLPYNIPFVFRKKL